MFDGIVDAFLGDPIELQADELVDHEDRLSGAQFAWDVKEVLGFAGELLQRRDQSADFNFDRVESARETASLAYGVVDQADQFFRRKFVGRGRSREVVLENPGFDS